ncbi:hypothetical protein [Acinetobacter baumannii]|uniref:hypothetical protein n=1 Tax=Acinetobacter baumannii TaxID=470 RepID=UPI003A8428C9
MNIKQKRQHFNKDLNKLVDNKHAVIPNELTWEQLQILSDDPEFFELYQEALQVDSGEDCACLIIKAIHNALLRLAGSH